MKIIGVTACPSGVAHTYMAAEALIQAGVKYDIEVKIETQGASGIEDQLTVNDIAEAKYVILSNDVEINGTDRFQGKEVLQMGVSDLIKKADAIMYTISKK